MIAEGEAKFWTEWCHVFPDLLPIFAFLLIQYWILVILPTYFNFVTFSKDLLAFFTIILFCILMTRHEYALDIVTDLINAWLGDCATSVYISLLGSGRRTVDCLRSGHVVPQEDDVTVEPAIASCPHVDGEYTKHARVTSHTCVPIAWYPVWQNRRNSVFCGPTTAI
jgi:hypothetical protein